MVRQWKTIGSTAVKGLMANIIIENEVSEAKMKTRQLSDLKIFYDFH